MDQKMAREVGTFSWNFKLTDQASYFGVHLRKSQWWRADHSVPLSLRPLAEKNIPKHFEQTDAITLQSGVPNNIFKKTLYAANYQSGM